MWTRAELKENAKKFFKFNYWKMVLVTFILTLLGGGGSSGSGFNVSFTKRFDLGSGHMSSAEMMGFLAAFFTTFTIIMVIAVAMSVFLYNPLLVGAQRFFVVSHYQKAKLDELGFAFSNGYGNVVKTMFLKGLFTSLWTLLFIVPGIIKGYEYRMIPYILAENPGIDYRDAFAASKQMMDGNKWNAFVLDLSFLGWNFLSVFTCGILSIFYVGPYVFMTNAELYVALKEITFGSRGQTYQNGQAGQYVYDDQAGQPGSNYQGYQSSQTYQNDQAGQSYQDDQTYQNGQYYANDQDR